MGGKKSEACGRCSMTAVLGATEPEEPEGTDGSDPFDGAAIEVSESEMRVAARPAVWLAAAKRRLDAFATRLTYGR